MFRHKHRAEVLVQQHHRRDNVDRPPGGDQEAAAASAAVKPTVGVKSTAATAITVAPKSAGLVIYASTVIL